MMDEFSGYGIIISPMQHVRPGLLFDARVGMVPFFSKPVQNNLLFSGALIEYCTGRRGNYYLLRQIQLLMRPSLWARDDLLFLHHVLELLSVYLPEQGADEELFAWCLQLFIESHVDRSLFCMLRLIFLANLLGLTGLYDHEYAVLDEIAYAYHQVPQESFIDVYAFDRRRFFMLEKILSRYHGVSTKKMIEWLYSCVQEHPKAHLLKTLHYLKSDYHAHMPSIFYYAHGNERSCST